MHRLRAIDGWSNFTTPFRSGWQYVASGGSGWKESIHEMYVQAWHYLRRYVISVSEKSMEKWNVRITVVNDVITLAVGNGLLSGDCLSVFLPFVRTVLLKQRRWLRRQDAFTAPRRVRRRRCVWARGRTC